MCTTPHCVVGCELRILRTAQRHLALAAALWALNQTAVPFTTTMVAVVSGYRDHTHQVYMSPIAPLHDSLALISQELEPLLLDGQYWSCPRERRALLLHMLRPLNLAESNSTALPLLVKDMIRDAAVCSKLQ